MRASHTPLFLIGAELFTPVPPFWSTPKIRSFRHTVVFHASVSTLRVCRKIQNYFFPQVNLKHPQHSVNQSGKKPRNHKLPPRSQSSPGNAHSGILKGRKYCLLQTIHFQISHMQIKSKRPNGRTLHHQRENFRIQFTAVFFPASGKFSSSTSNLFHEYILQAYLMPDKQAGRHHSWKMTHPSLFQAMPEFAPA